jgi:hypothetical protein
MKIKIEKSVAVIGKIVEFNIAELIVLRSLSFEIEALNAQLQSKDIELGLRDHFHIMTSRVRIILDKITDKSCSIAEAEKALFEVEPLPEEIKPIGRIPLEQDDIPFNRL